MIDRNRTKNATAHGISHQCNVKIVWPTNSHHLIWCSWYKLGNEKNLFSSMPSKFYKMMRTYI